MLTPKQLINTLREDFSLSLKDEKVIFLINTLESKLEKYGIIDAAQTFSYDNLSTASLSLGDEYIEIYIYHILSKEAILQGDIVRLNNFSTLYNAALGNLFSEKQNRNISFKNLW